ncbi:MAG: hypothetical protein H7Z19_01965, partial [Chitinophagaceae bacterium]|nr:hypothetical protein [Rubrivivax sp.]
MTPDPLAPVAPPSLAQRPARRMARLPLGWALLLLAAVAAAVAGVLAIGLAEVL